MRIGPRRGRHRSAPMAAQRPAGRELRRGLGRRPRTPRSDRRPRRDLAGGLSVQRPDGASGVRDREASAADRTAQAAELGEGDRSEGRAGIRGPGRRGQGRDDQAVHRAPQPPRCPCRRPGQALGARAEPVVLPAVRAAPARRRGDRDVRPVLVQPGRRRARHGVLLRRRVPAVHAAGAGVRTDAGRQRRTPGRSSGSRSPAGSSGPDSSSARSTRSGSGSSPRPTSRRWTSGTTTPRPRRRCSCTPTPSTPRGR